MTSNPKFVYKAQSSTKVNHGDLRTEIKMGGQRNSCRAQRHRIAGRLRFEMQLQEDTRQEAYRGRVQVVAPSGRKRKGVEIILKEEFVKECSGCKKCQYE